MAKKAVEEVEEVEVEKVAQAGGKKLNTVIFADGSKKLLTDKELKELKK